MNPCYEWWSIVWFGDYRERSGVGSGEVSIRMQQRATGIVTEVQEERPGAQEILVRILDAVDNGSLNANEYESVLSYADSSDTVNQFRRAIAYTQLTGAVRVGDKVLLNTVAVELGLGTGRSDFVIATLESASSDEVVPGHIIKLRYTPLQTPVLSVEAPESPHHQAIKDFVSLDETPVVCAELHSQIPVVCSAARWALHEAGWNRAPRIIYIMTEGAALPLALSRLIPQTIARGLIDATITSGQAFGGDYEAVNLYSALAAAKAVCAADIIVVGQGPGNVGTDTQLGFSGVEQGLAVNAVASLEGVPVVVARISFAEERMRHWGISHHTLTVLKTIARAPVLLPLPRLSQSKMHTIEQTLLKAEIEQDHQPIVVNADRALDNFVETGFDVTTMGRSIEGERPFFLAAAAAGILAAQLVEAGEETSRERLWGAKDAADR